MSTDEYVLTSTAGKQTLGHRLNKLDATTAPTATDDASSDYEVMSIWVDTTADKAYICVDSTATAAVWVEVTVSDHGGLAGLGDDDHTQYILHTIADAKGDLLAASAADTYARLAVGTDGQALTCARDRINAIEARIAAHGQVAYADRCEQIARAGARDGELGPAFGLGHEMHVPVGLKALADEFEVAVDRPGIGGGGGYRGFDDSAARAARQADNLAGG